MRPAFRILLVSSAFALVATAPSSFTVDELEALEAERRAAEAELAALENAGTTTGRDLEALEAQLISAAMESRRREEQAAIAERRLIDLRTRMLSTQASLLEDRAALEDILGILATTSRESPPALIVSPDRANEAVRRAIVAGDAGPRLAERVAALDSEIATLARLEREIVRERARLDAAEAVLALREAEIEQLAAAKRAAFENVSGNADELRARVEALAEQADTLRALLADLEMNAPAMPGQKPELRPQLASADIPGQPGLGHIPAPAAPEPQLEPLGAAEIGQMTRPAAGLVARGFGDRMPGGGESEGLYIDTRSGAQVLAPADGRIEYAGRFRSYGEMLILRTSDDYHVILSGLGRLYVTVGQTVSAGEPVGQMAERSDPPPQLYLELRQGEAPVNPARWMSRGR